MEEDAGGTGGTDTGTYLWEPVIMILGDSLADQARESVGGCGLGAAKDSACEVGICFDLHQESDACGRPSQIDDPSPGE